MCVRETEAGPAWNSVLCNCTQLHVCDRVALALVFSPVGLGVWSKALESGTGSVEFC